MILIIVQVLTVGNGGNLDQDHGAIDIVVLQTNQLQHLGAEYWRVH